MFATDDDIVKDYVSVTKCINALQKTHGYGFYLRMGTNINYFYMLQRPENLPCLLDIDEDIRAWQFAVAADEWAYPLTVDMTIYPKEEIKYLLNAMNYSNPNTLEDQLAGYAYNSPAIKKRVGLCYTQSKIVNLPLNRVQNVFKNSNMGIKPKELLNQFDKGFKINRGPLHQWNNISVHAEYNPTFIKR